MVLCGEGSRIGEGGAGGREGVPFNSLNFSMITTTFLINFKRNKKY